MQLTEAATLDRKSGEADLSRLPRYAPLCPGLPRGLPWGMPWRDPQFHSPEPMQTEASLSSSGADEGFIDCGKIMLCIRYGLQPIRKRHAMNSALAAEDVSLQQH